MKKQLQRLIPQAMLDDALVRAGANQDGGYLVPRKALGCRSVVSIGIGGDVSFDYCLAEQGATIYQFDPTVSGVPGHQKHPNFVFRQEGWGCPGHPNRDLSAMLPESPGPSLLKCDIEGAELPNLAALSPKDLARFDYLVFELHELGRLAEPGFLAQFTKVVDNLTYGHCPVHLHGNNYASVASVHGASVPWVMEITLSKGPESGVPLGSYNSVHDFPNNPNGQGINMDALVTTWL